MGAKYASRIGFTVEKFNECQQLYGQSHLQKFVIAFLFLELIKNMLI